MHVTNYSRLSIGIVWLVWTITTTVTVGVSRVLVTYIQNLVPGDNLPIDIVAIGLCAGFVQWLILRRYLSISGWWILATSLWALAWLLIFAFRVFGAFIGGALVGSGQWLVFRSRVDRAERWIVVSSLGWGIAAMLLTGVLFDIFVGYTADFILYHALVAMITGLGLAWLIDMNSDYGGGRRYQA